MNRLVCTHVITLPGRNKKDRQSNEQMKKGQKNEKWFTTQQTKDWAIQTMLQIRGLNSRSELKSAIIRASDWDLVHKRYQKFQYNSKKCDVANFR
jgi:rRNA maturation endonuclease Nob1